MSAKTAPWGLVTLGLMLMLGAFLYGAGNALPYQDPNSELLAIQAANAAKANFILALGFFLTVAGGVWLRIRSRSKKSQSQS